MTSGKQGAVLALHLVLLSGCALVGPDHQTPTTELSAGFANANQPGLSTDPAHTRWWQGFKDQELERLVDLAVAGNHDLRVATARLREARALWDETAFDRYPTVTADAAYSNERRSETALQGFGGADRDVGSTTPGSMPSGNSISSAVCAAPSKPAPRSVMPLRLPCTMSW